MRICGELRSTKSVYLRRLVRTRIEHARTSGDRGSLRIVLSAVAAGAAALETRPPRPARACSARKRATGGLHH